MDLGTLQKTPNGNTTLNNWKQQYAIQEKPKIKEMTTMEIYQAKSQPSCKGLAKKQQDLKESEDNKSKVKTTKDAKHLMSFQSGEIVVDNHSPLKERNCMKVLKGFFCISLYDPPADIKLVKADLFEQYQLKGLNNTVNCFLRGNCANSK